MEGSLRQAATRLRVAVQLVDTSSGAHLWAETYDRALQPRRGVRRCSTTSCHASSPRSATRTACCRTPRVKRSGARPPGDEPVRGRAAQLRVASRASAPKSTRRCVPASNGRSSRRLATRMRGPCSRDRSSRITRSGFNVGPDPLGRALRAARRAIDAAPSNRLGAPGAGPGAVLPQGVAGVPHRGGTRHRAQPHGRLHGRDPSAPDGVRGRLGARLRAGRTGHGSSTPIIPGWYWFARLLQRLPQGRLPRRARLRAQGQTCRRVLVHARATAAAARPARGTRGRVGGAAASCSRSSRTSRSTVREEFGTVVPAGSRRAH